MTADETSRENGTTDGKSEVRPVSPPVTTPTTTSSKALAAQAWLTRPERGALVGIRLVFWLATLLGRWPARQFVRFLALYYALFDRSARRASRDWLRRVLGVEPRYRDIYHHFSCFAQVSLDRIFLLKGRTEAFNVTRTGPQYLANLRDTNTGAVLLGAHLGSFEAMRAGADEDELSLNIVGHFDNAKMVNSLLDRIDPAMRARVIDVGRNPISSTLKIRERIADGEMVALLGDRLGINEKSVEVEFLGAPARFPTGPFLLASMLKCPVYLVFGLYYEPNRYELFCEPFAETLSFPRGNRQAALEETVQRFAHRLEFYARKAPYNWFNFFDFWNN